MTCSSPVRVLHCLGSLQCGGAETLVMRIYRHLDREQVQFDFLLHDDRPGIYEEEAVSLGARVFRIPPPRLLGLRGYDRAVTAVLRQEGPFGGIHSHLHHWSGYLLWLAYREGIPLRIAHAHSTADGKPNLPHRWLYRSLLQRLLLHNATHMFAPAVAACQAVFKCRPGDDPRVRYLPNAIDLLPFFKNPIDRIVVRTELGLPLSVPCVGHIGRFETPKNHVHVVETFGALRERVPEAELVLIGDGKLRLTIGNLVRDMRIADHVHFLGVRSDVHRILRALDVFVFPSLWEGLGVAVVEAQAAGLACVVSGAIPREADVGLGLVEFVDLRASRDEWVGRVMDALARPRPSSVERETRLRAAGYDIAELASYLQGVYLRG